VPQRSHSIWADRLWRPRLGGPASGVKEYERRVRGDSGRVYTGRLDEVKSLVPQAKRYQDFRRMLDDKTIDRRGDCHTAAPTRLELRSGDPSR